MELLTGLGLASTAGLNAYIPVVGDGTVRPVHPFGEPSAGLGLAGERLGDGDRRRALVVEVVADKIPALDSVNDAIQTLVRPTAGGIVFGAGTASQTAAVTDPGPSSLRATGFRSRSVSSWPW